MTDQETREAREWAEYITAVPKLYGTFAPQARAAARFILDNTDPPLPDPLFGARATHPEYGEGVVGSHFPDEDGKVQFVFPDEAFLDGTSYRWVPTAALTFHTTNHPVILEAEEDYRSAPEGTIVAQDEGKPFVLIYGLWRNPNPWRGDHGEMAGIRRRVLRWGWEA